MMTVNKILKKIIDISMTVVLVVGILFIFLYIIGIEPIVVQSGSMSPTITTGSLSFINKNAKYKDIKVNDIIVYKIPIGDRVMHRAVNITNEGIETKGDKNECVDAIKTTEDIFVGKAVFTIPKVGYFVKYIQTTSGKIILITIIIVILVAGFFFDDNEKKENKKQKNKT